MCDCVRMLANAAWVVMPEPYASGLSLVHFCPCPNTMAFLEGSMALKLNKI